MQLSALPECVQAGVAEHMARRPALTLHGFYEWMGLDASAERVASARVPETRLAHLITFRTLGWVVVLSEPDFRLAKVRNSTTRHGYKQAHYGEAA